MYKVILVSALVVCAQALPNPGVGFPEEVRSRTGSRIIDGSPAKPGQIPYQAFLMLSRLGLRTACGGSLISPDWVLTAGHCMSLFNTAEIYLGNIRYDEAAVIMKSTELFLHPNYSSIAIRNDIGLIALPRSVQLTPDIQPIVLPTNPTITFAGKQATVSGFGLTVEGGAISPVLNFAPVRVIGNLVCQSHYPLNVRDSIICTVGVDNEAQGTCNGDSGGPLVTDDNGVLKQIGIVSFGSSAGCDDPKPKGYVRPTHFIPWISEVTGLTFTG